jgi:hypothetical protein
MKQPPKKDVLHDLYFNKGYHLRKIGKIMGYSVQTIHKYFHIYGFIAVSSRFKKGDKSWNAGLHHFNDKRILSGENHPRWMGVSKYYIEFKLLSRDMRAKKTKCSNCSNSAQLLHHLDKNTNNNAMNNLIPLCFSCHTTLHNKERGVTVYKHNCEWCGKQFTVLNNRQCQQKCCSLKCKSLYQYHIKKNHPLISHNLA